METILEHYDVIGAVMIAVAFALLTADIVGKYSYVYIFLNFLGSLVILVKAIATDSWGVAILQVLWMGSSGALLLIKLLYGHKYGDDMSDVYGKGPR